MNRDRRRTKVLIVDDSQIIREVVQFILQEEDYDVVGIDSPIAFTRTLVQEKPDVVLMDVNMPALTGDKLVEITLRSGLHRCPIVLFSDRPDTELARLVEECGAAGYIRKTQDPSNLSLKLRRFLPSRHPTPALT
ncbi:response regulator [Chondromyces apiculatus]|uniref:Response regulator receiver protein n=1 Tax=Chondromyces apiculatus DSM 436 TaxID=1192034 RepID=A0A017TGW8_9BACT|nr:response regulator [Chondromyces apiculatus]EYF07866.1 response regulator receiver protein [Chondromyces apiculatus DSM 436]